MLDNTFLLIVCFLDEERIVFQGGWRVNACRGVDLRNKAARRKDDEDQKRESSHNRCLRLLKRTAGKITNRLCMPRRRTLHAGYRATGAMNAASAAGIEHWYTCQTSGTSFNKRILDGIMALRTNTNLRAELFFQADHRSTCESSPPTRKATTHVPAHTVNASRQPRSFIITINEAMHGVKSVIVTSATTIW